MRVLTVMASGARGGGADHLVGILPELRSLGHEGPVAVGADGPTAGRLRDLGFEVTEIDLMHRRASVATTRRLAQLIRRQRPDIVHAHGTRAAFYCALAQPLLRQGGMQAPPWVYTAHGLSYRRAVSLPATGSLLRAPFFAAEGLICRTADRVVSVSAADLEDLARRRLLDPVRGVHIPNAVDTQRFRPLLAGQKGAAVRTRARARMGLADEQGPVVGTVSRLVPQKSIADLVAAMAHIPNATCVVIGDGPQRRTLERRATGLGERIRWLGSRGDVPELLGAFDVFVLTSRWEGEPIALLEAMACGLPIVATATDGAQEIIEEGRNGRLVAVGDPVGIAGAIRELLADPDQQRRIGKAARRLTEARSWARAAASLAEVYDGVASNR